MIRIFLNKLHHYFRLFVRWFTEAFARSSEGAQEQLPTLPSLDEALDAETTLRVLRKGKAMRVIFFYPGEEGTFMDQCDVTLYENGILHLSNATEESTTHLQNCEILWRYQVDSEDKTTNKVRLLKPRDPERSPESPSPIN